MSNDLLEKLDGLVLPLEADTDFPEIPITLFGNKYTPGGEAADGVLPMKEAFLECWPTDVHFALYQHPACLRLLKGVQHVGIKFQIACLDLDFNNHLTKPTDEDFVGLVRLARLLEPKPSLIYPTSGGARLVYCIQTITDELTFERYYQGLIHEVSAQVTRGQEAGLTRYGVDLQTRDWTRLFRAPRVVRDGVEQFDRDTFVLHNDLMDLTTLKVKAIPMAPVVPIVHGFKHGKPIRDARYRHAVDTIGDGNRNQTVFKLAAYAFSNYGPDAADAWIDAIENLGEAAGLSQREVQRTIRSAQDYLGRTGCTTNTTNKESNNE
jgi:hypothetical protein